MHAPFFGLCQCLAQNLKVKPLDLQVHLQGSNAMLGTGDLEVHVTQGIFQPLNIAQDFIGTRFLILNQAHRNARDRHCDRHTGIHQRQGAATDRTHAGRAIAADSFADHA